jgi:hypothetical protein
MRQSSLTQSGHYTREAKEGFSIAQSEKALLAREWHISLKAAWAIAVWSGRMIERLQPLKTPRKSHYYLVLINEPAVALFGQASLIMRNLRTKR